MSSTAFRKPPEAKADSAARGCDGVAEKEFKPMPWEGDMPLSCRHCGNVRYVSALCYDAHAAKAEITRLSVENERLKMLIDLIQNDIRNLSRENFKQMQAGIDYRPKPKGVRASV